MESAEADARQQANAFEVFARAEGRRLRQALVTRYGVEVGSDATDAALAWAWEHWERLSPMANPVGYLFRVGQTSARRALGRGRPVAMPPERAGAADEQATTFDGELAAALLSLSEVQRMVVLLVHAYGWTPAEVAERTNTPAGTVRSNLHRGLRRLRHLLREVELR